MEGRADLLLAPAPVAERLCPELERFFEPDLSEEGLRALRRASATGRPLGAADWVKKLETSTGRRLTDPPRGRPPPRRAAEPEAEGAPLV